MDLDDDYANAAHIPDGMGYPARWAAAASAYRGQMTGACDLPYGAGPRARFDLFLPVAPPKGTVVFVHGGYWRMFDKSSWSHLAAGPVARGWAVAMPSYPLAPAAGLPQIAAAIAQAVGVIAARGRGPLRLVGHSAGGQIIARLLSLPAAQPWRAQVQKLVPISPLSDLAPLMRTSMNADLGITPAIAAQESPLHLPPPPVPVTVWVGAAERPAFLAQAAALAQAWSCPLVQAAGRHHFDVIAELAEPDSALTRAVLA